MYYYTVLYLENKILISFTNFSSAFRKTNEIVKFKSINSVMWILDKKAISHLLKSDKVSYIIILLDQLLHRLHIAYLNISTDKCHFYFQIEVIFITLSVIGTALFYFVIMILYVRVSRIDIFVPFKKLPVQEDYHFYWFLLFKKL